ncbi:hypothetical protein F5Y02DRAFT_397657 [Annulohypoxylon stygium]|nr:hypothetical protein F5Y02DRAFT_397657 [Annulohypoxylon stygium]
MSLIVHYPLNGLDLDFNRYEHRPFGAREIMVNRIMEEFMAPKRVEAEVYNRRSGTYEELWKQIKSLDKRLGLDVQVLFKLLRTYHCWPPRITLTQEYSTFLSVILIWPYVQTRTDFDSAILGLVERHYLECHPSLRIILRFFQSWSTNQGPKEQSGWKKDMIEHLKEFQSAKETQYLHHLYSKSHYLPPGPTGAQFSIEPCFVVAWKLSYTSARKTIFENMPKVHRGRSQRSKSLPPDGAWGTAAIKNYNPEEKFVIYFPRRRLSELDKLSRRRSLSRTHIKEMFTDFAPKLYYKKPTGKDTLKNKCENCAQYTHRTKDCKARCGFCGLSFHKASGCKVKSSNRCKCQPFPQFHTAQECYVRCSRACGSPYHPGHFKHKNAMTCSYRCCMCGIKGHSGRKCSFKKCPCGERHLTQDCRWKVECPAKGCHYYLCSLHCRECGKKKEKGTQDSFVGRTCQDCLKNGKPASVRV